MQRAAVTIRRGGLRRGIEQQLQLLGHGGYSLAPVATLARAFVVEDFDEI